MQAVHVLGVPSALGGHLPGMERTPGRMRNLGFVERLATKLPDHRVRDHGDLTIEPGFREDHHPRLKNRDLIAALLPRISTAVGGALETDVDQVGPLVLLGGDCIAHAGALAGLRRAMGGRAVALAWFDAHGDFNTPETTPSGNVWGMPFAIACGRGDPVLVTAASAPSVREGHAALLGGQVLDEAESRALASSSVAHFGAGMLATAGGRAALGAWAATVARDVGGLYIAIDLDCLDAAGGWAVQMPEPGGLSLETAVASVRTLAGAAPVVGFGATGVNLDRGDATATLEAVVTLVEAALGRRRGERSG
jgi:arginase